MVDDRKFTTAAALGTILSKIFGLRGQNFNSLLERCPTFVSKEKSFKARLIGRSRKVCENKVPERFFNIAPTQINCPSSFFRASHIFY